WKFYFTMMGSTGLAALQPAVTFHWTQIQNIMRDPFENNVGDEQKGALAAGGALAAPSTAYLYDWNLLPIGQLLWEKQLMSYKTFPPLQAPETYNLEGILRQIQSSNHPRVFAPDPRSERLCSIRARNPPAPPRRDGSHPFRKLSRFPDTSTAQPD